MQAVRYLSAWGYRSPGDTQTIPYRDAIRLRDIGAVEFIDAASMRYADAQSLTRRSLNLTPASLDEKERTVEAIIATDTPVARSDYTHGSYDEVLVCRTSAVDLSRLNASAPILDSHNRSGLDEVLGVVVPGSAKAAGRGVVAKLKFAQTEEGMRAWQMVRDGLNSISIGYMVAQREIDDTTAPPTHRITSWTPYEVSLVAVPADTAAGFL